MPDETIKRTPDAVTGSTTAIVLYHLKDRPMPRSYDEHVPNDDGMDEFIALKMLNILQEHGWDFTYGRDPVLILIEIEEYIQNGETD